MPLNILLNNVWKMLKKTFWSTPRAIAALEIQPSLLDSFYIEKAYYISKENRQYTEEKETLNEMQIKQNK